MIIMDLSVIKTVKTKLIGDKKDIDISAPFYIYDDEEEKSIVDITGTLKGIYDNWKVL